MARKKKTETLPQHELSLDELKMRLKKIAMGDLNKYLKVNNNGMLEYDFTGASQEDLLLIQEADIQYDPKTGLVRKFKVSKIDPLKAIEQLCKIEGHYAPEKSEVNMEASVEERLARGRMQVRKLGVI